MTTPLYTALQTFSDRLHISNCQLPIADFDVGLAAPQKSRRLPYFKSAMEIGNRQWLTDR